MSKPCDVTSTPCLFLWLNSHLLAPSVCGHASLEMTEGLVPILGSPAGQPEDEPWGSNTTDKDMLWLVSLPSKDKSRACALRHAPDLTIWGGEMMPSWYSFESSDSPLETPGGQVSFISPTMCQTVPVLRPRLQACTSLGWQFIVNIDGQRENGNRPFKSHFPWATASSIYMMFSSGFRAGDWKGWCVPQCLLQHRLWQLCVFVCVCGSVFPQPRRWYKPSGA